MHCFIIDETLAEQDVAFTKDNSPVLGHGKFYIDCIYHSLV